MLPLVIQIERTEERVADTCAFAKSPVRIGRNSLNDLQLEEGFVSQWHGVIRFDEEGVTYLDLGSTNPTLIDGQPAQRNVEIPIEETTDFRIGSLRLHLLRVAAPPDLYGARRRTAFARTGDPVQGDLSSTMYLGDHTPDPLNPMALPQAPAVAVTAPVGKAAAPKARPDKGRLGPTPGVQITPTASSGLASDYERYRTSWSTLFNQLRLELQAAEPAQREALVDSWAQRYPQVGRESDFRALLSELGVSPLRTGVPEMEDWLGRLTGGLFPPPGVPINIAMAMERIGEVLEVFATAFVELRKAQDEFCDEMGLERPPDDSMLQTTENPQAVLAYLLNPGREGGIKVAELSRAMADYAVHQVALVSAVVQGAQDMLEDLSPRALAGEEGADQPGDSGFWGKLLGGQKKELWDRYLEAFEEAVDEDRFTRKLFGRGFARKYYAITGGRASKLPKSRG